MHEIRYNCIEPIVGSRKVTIYNGTAFSITIKRYDVIANNEKNLVLCFVKKNNHKWALCFLVGPMLFYSCSEKKKYRMMLCNEPEKCTFLFWKIIFHFVPFYCYFRKTLGNCQWKKPQNSSHLKVGTLHTQK